MQLDNAARVQGVGRNTDDENFWLAKRDLRAFRDLLGNEQFVCGDKMTKVCKEINSIPYKSPHHFQYDCTIFGALAQFYFSPQDHPLLDYVRKHDDCASIRQYILRIKKQLWGDEWE